MCQHMPRRLYVETSYYLKWPKHNHSTKKYVSKCRLMKYLKMFLYIRIANTRYSLTTCYLNKIRWYRTKKYVRTSGNSHSIHFLINYYLSTFNYEKCQDVEKRVVGCEVMQEQKNRWADIICQHENKDESLKEFIAWFVC